jgi:hypothetical protein
MHTRGRDTLLQSIMDMMWYSRSFVASNIDAQEKFKNPVGDLMFSLR